MPCDAACIKIIINTRFMSLLAPQLQRVPSAVKLAAAATIYSGMLTAVGLTVTSPPEGFDGCDQAQKLVAWIADPGKADEALMKKWTSELWAQIADLAVGKLPQ